MPLYEYRCEACGQREEKLESLSAPQVHDCPGCSVPSGMKRQISIAAFSLTGEGWFKGSATEPVVATPKAETPKPEASASGHGCGAGGCGCPFAS
jgi:putative FmdB family regulatory protein